MFNSQNQHFVVEEWEKTRLTPFTKIYIPKIVSPQDVLRDYLRENNLPDYDD